MQYERQLKANGKRILVRSRSAAARSTRAIVIAHGRFQIHSYLTAEADVPVPAGLKIYHYIRHTETFNSGTAARQYWKMQLGNSTALPAAKQYTSSGSVKNYTLRPDEHFKSITVSEFAPYDVILPLEILRVDDLLQAVRKLVLTYAELHFICCRAIRISAAGLF